MYPVFIPIYNSFNGNMSAQECLVVCLIFLFIINWVPFIFKSTIVPFNSRKEFIIYLLNSLLNPIWLICLFVWWCFKKYKKIGENNGR